MLHCQTSSFSRRQASQRSGRGCWKGTTNEAKSTAIPPSRWLLLISPACAHLQIQCNAIVNHDSRCKKSFFATESIWSWLSVEKFGEKFEKKPALISSEFKVTTIMRMQTFSETHFYHFDPCWSVCHWVKNDAERLVILTRDYRNQFSIDVSNKCISMCAFYVGLWSISVIVFSAVQPGALAQVQFLKLSTSFKMCLKVVLSQPVDWP